MARSNVAQTQNTGRDGTSDARGVRVRRSLLGSLPLAVLLALMALLIMPATATATGAGPGISVSPTQGGVGTRVTLNGTRFPSGDQITIGYSNGTLRQWRHHDQWRWRRCRKRWLVLVLIPLAADR